MFIMYPAFQCSELRLHIKGVRCFQFVFCLQLDVFGGHTLSSTLSIMHLALLRAILKFLIHCVASSYVSNSKQNTHTTL